jgi:predicted short-subunit dehydrogenase-like oxidoreductase (DUF2520 family)
VEVDRVTVIGAGRMGQGMALALRRSGLPALLWGRRAKPVHRELHLQTGPLAKAVGEDGVLLLAVPDDAIAGLARELADTGGVRRGHVVLHLSGLQDREVLAPLAAVAGGLGSFHPLQTIADPADAAERWRGAYAAIEGDAIAREAGRVLAERLGLTPVEVPASAKPAYHIAAVFCANYVVTLAAVAEELAVEAGIEPRLAANMYLPLLAGAVGNLAGRSPAEALTGPIVRGDVATVRRHLEVLEGARRQLYAELGLATLALARSAGLGAERAEPLERLLRAATAR